MRRETEKEEEEEYRSVHTHHNRIVIVNKLQIKADNNTSHLFIYQTLLITTLI